MDCDKMNAQTDCSRDRSHLLALDKLQLMVWGLVLASDTLQRGEHVQCKMWTHVLLQSG